MQNAEQGVEAGAMVLDDAHRAGEGRRTARVEIRKDPRDRGWQWERRRRCGVH
jgi:hypothetical protein